MSYSLFESLENVSSYFPWACALYIQMIILNGEITTERTEGKLHASRYAF